MVSRIQNPASRNESGVFYMGVPIFMPTIFKYTGILSIISNMVEKFQYTH